MLSLLSLLALSPLARSSPISPEAAVAGSSSQPDVAAQPAAAVGKPTSEGGTTFDGVALANMPAAPAAEAVAAEAVGRDGWTCTVDSAQPGNPCENVLDGDAATFWHTPYDAGETALPHQITINFGATILVGGILIQPRGDNANGNIGQHVISLR